MLTASNDILEGLPEANFILAGLPEANFIERAHDKKDFERTVVLFRLETSLKQMKIEYWNLHCALSMLSEYMIENG